MSPLDSFTSLMNRLKAGEDGAARVVFERFANRLIGLARKSLDGRLLQKVDPEDVVQSAYKSFFLGQRDGGWEFGGWDGLWGMLTLITLRKCANRAEYYSAEKRDVRRELPPATDSVGGAVDAFALDREPQPEEAALLVETVQSLFQSLTDPDERAILEMSLQGFTATEICDQTGRAERSVRRLRERTRKRLERMQSED